MSIITYFENHNPLCRPLNQPRRRSGRQDRKNGAVDLRHLDGVLQDLGFAPKPHPTIFTENEPDTVFDGLEKFQKANRLTVDGAVKNKDSETGIALNKAMAEYYVPTKPRRAGGTQNALNAKTKQFGTDPKLAKQKGERQSNAELSIPERIDELQWNLTQLKIMAANLFEELKYETNPKHREDIREELEIIKQQIEDIEDEIRILRQGMA